MLLNDKVSIDYIKDQMSAERFQHSLSVAENAGKLAVVHHVNVDDAKSAGLLHDLCREWPNERILLFLDQKAIKVSTEKRKVPVLLHGLVASTIIKERFGITDQNIINAVKNHTLGAKNMSALEKIVFLADTLASVAETDPVKYQLIFNAAVKSLEKGVSLTYELTAQYFKEKGLQPISEFFENWAANKTTN